MNVAALSWKDEGTAVLIEQANSGDDLQVVPAKSRAFALKAGSVTLHSLYDPEREAREWVRHYRDRIGEAPTVVVLGFGLGYHIRALCEETDSEIIVFEPRADILRQAFELFDFSAVIPRIRIVVNGEMPGIRGSFAVLDHKPSLSLSPNYFAHVRSRLDALQGIRDGLRIIVVGPFYGGSLSVARHCASALQNLGHDVTFVDNSICGDAFRGIEEITENRNNREHLRLMLNEFASEAVIARCVDKKPDLVFALAQAPMHPASLAKLRQNDIPTAFWFVEDCRLRGYWRKSAPLYDCFFTIQRGRFMDELRAMGVQAGYLPLAASPEVHRPLGLTQEEHDLYGSNVSFVGAGYRNRRHFLAGVLDYGLKVWGSEWDMASPLAPFVQRSGQWIETDEIVKIFNATKVSINLHSSAHHDGVDPAGDFVNPRTFEIAACRGFQIVDHRSELAALFDIGSEIVCFTDLGDLRKKVGYYLERPDERMAVAERARERVLKDHTYEVRMEEMLHFIADNGRLFSGDRPRRAGREALVEEAGRDTPLGQYLSAVPKKGALSLDDIVDGFAQGESKLSETERVFMLMNEIKKVYTKK